MLKRMFKDAHEHRENECYTLISVGEEKIEWQQFDPFHFNKWNLVFV